MLALAIGASAANSITTAGSYATVATDGACQVTLTATLHLESAQDDLSVLLPADARDVTLNGDRVRTTKYNGLRKVDLSKIVGKVAGEFTVTLHYALPDVVNTDENGILQPGSGDTSIFIYPGYKFKMLDCLITNFHLPESTLLMLVSALAGRENVLKVYEEAVRERYRFFSFGDACFFGDLK
jgi:hypothetical protein